MERRRPTCHRRAFVVSSLLLLGHKFPVRGALAQGASPVPAFNSHDVTILPDLGHCAVAIDINARGEAVGWSRQVANGPIRPIVWRDGQVFELPMLGGINGAAYAINEEGVIVGQAETDTHWPHPVMWVDDAIVDLGTLGGLTGAARGINDAGDVVGCADDPDEYRHAFHWQDGAMEDLGTLGGLTSSAAAINGRGQIVGVADVVSSAGRAVLWDASGIIELGTLGGRASSAIAINDAGTVVGWSETGDLSDPMGKLGRAFRWQDGRMEELGTLDGETVVRSTAVEINRDGEIVGVSEAESGESHATLWSDAAIIDLGQPGMSSDATGINDGGVVVGWQTDAEDVPTALRWDPRT